MWNEKEANQLDTELLWPRIFTVKDWNIFISGTGKSIEMEQKGCGVSIMHDYHHDLCVTKVDMMDVADSDRVILKVAVPSTRQIVTGVSVIVV